MVRFDHRQDVRAAQIRLLYEQLPSALIATVLNAAILFAVLWNEVSRILLVSWMSLILVVALARFGLRRTYLRIHSNPAKVLEYGRPYLYGVLANGVLWGIAGFFFFLPDKYVYQVFLAFVLMGMASGGISTLASSRGAYLTFLVPAVLPYGVRLFMVGGALHMAMAGMLVIYVPIMGIIGLRLYSTVTESLDLRFENVDLLRSLTAAQDALQKSYSELERRVEERTADLRISEEALRFADKRKDEFLAMLGHELRNPLAPIRNALQVMNRADASDSSAKWAREVIDRQIDHLTRLVDDLLDVSRIMYGKISLHRTVLQVATVINHAVEASLPLIEDRRQKLLVRVPAEPLWIKGDLVRMGQVVFNLLSNAAKYSAPGTHIALDVESSDQWITIRVQDNGIGIPEDVLPHIFELFVQANHSLARTQGGLGIGLTVVKRLVEMHGGRIEARSEGPGQGSEFRVSLPRLQAPVQEEPRVSHAQAQPESELPLRVLIVDDNQDAAETLALLMKLEGYNVAVAYDGVTALAEESRFQPEVVLLDIGMPGMDGYEVARELRRRESGKPLVLIALTGYGQPEDRSRAEEAGFNDHITKPINPDDLNTLIKAHSRGKH